MGFTLLYDAASPVYEPLKNSYVRKNSLSTPTTRQLTNKIFSPFLHVWRRFPFCHSPKFTVEKLTAYGYFSTVNFGKWQNGKRKFFGFVCSWNNGECREKGGEWDDLLGVGDFFDRRKKPNWTNKFRRFLPFSFSFSFSYPSSSHRLLPKSGNVGYFLSGTPKWNFYTG